MPTQDEGLAGSRGMAFPATDSAMSDTAFLALTVGSLNFGLFALAAAIFRAAKVYADSYEDDDD